jgi:phage-related protein
MEQLAKRAPSEFGAVRHHISLLREFGVLLSAPYSRQLERRLRELRPGPWGITYFADERRRMILLTSFRKRGRRTDGREIARARKAMLDWDARSR